MKAIFNSLYLFIFSTDTMFQQSLSEGKCEEEGGHRGEEEDWVCGKGENLGREGKEMRKGR